MLVRMSELPAISSTVHVVRHGEVENPHSILYGRQPGWKLSERGQEMARLELPQKERMRSLFRINYRFGFCDHRWKAVVSCMIHGSANVL